MSTSVAVVGQDFPAEHLKLLKDKGIDTSGIQRQEGRTFRWKGEYGFDFNTAVTVDTQLNVFADFTPTLQPEPTRHEISILGQY